jgi:hypothetical protein
MQETERHYLHEIENSRLFMTDETCDIVRMMIEIARFVLDMATCILNDGMGTIVLHGQATLHANNTMSHNLIVDDDKSTSNLK